MALLGRVDVTAHDVAAEADPKGPCVGSAGRWKINGAVGAGGKQEAMVSAVRARVNAYDLAVVVDPKGLGVRSAGEINVAEVAIVKQEAMESEGRVFFLVHAHDLVMVVDPKGLGLESAGDIDRFERQGPCSPDRDDPQHNAQANHE
jgi:hypothetical protein